MRTSRTSQETTKRLQALSPRRTRGSTNPDLNLQRFAYDNPREIKDEDVSSLSSVNTVDIEDVLEPPAKRRKAAPVPAAPSVPARARQTPNGAPTKRTRRTPARKIKTDGATTVQPPSDWETIYNTVKKMRAMNPTAPVDTMGCAELYWRASSVKDQRFHILIALMLSSQTKDTVTAVAMGRLHTELGAVEEDSAVKKEEDIEDGVKTEDDIKKEVIKKKDDIEDGAKEEDVKKEDGEENQASTLTLQNILAVSPQRLNELIRTVGFHNNKTKYIKATAQILHDKFNSDIPSTAPELMSLPGVGPKMAYLCMSAAWGKHDGIGVDVHVHRITNLWGWHKTKNPEETRAALESWLPRDKWHEINKLLVGLGQTICLPVGRKCGECDLAGTKLCKSEVRGK